MPDSGTGRLLRLSAGDICGVKWRPTRFAGDTLHRYACSLCGVIPRSTVLLPCAHALCETCKCGCGRDGAGSVCPIDQEPFDDEDCNTIVLPGKKVSGFKVFAPAFILLLPALFNTSWAILPVLGWRFYDGKNDFFLSATDASMEAALPPWILDTGWKAQATATTSSLSAYKEHRLPPAPCGLGSCAMAQLSHPLIFAMQVYCWNQAYGCQFVASFSSVLRHYEEECAFQAVECPRCGDSFVHTALAAHYTTGCREYSSSAVTDDHSPSEEHAIRVSDVSAALEEVKALLTDPFQEQLPAMESQVNRLVEDATNHGALLREISEALRTIQHSLSGELKQMAEKSPAALGEQAQLQSEGFTSQTGRKKKQRKKQKAKEEACAEAEEPIVAEAPLPWHLEKKHILRRLYLMASESLAHLQDVRQGAIELMIQPIAKWERRLAFKYRQLDSSFPVFSFNVGRDEILSTYYMIRVKLPGLIRDNDAYEEERENEEKPEFCNIWHWEDAYFRVAVYVDHEDRFQLRFRFAGTLETSSLRSHVEDVTLFVKNPPNSCKFQKGDVSSFCRDPHEWDQIFWEDHSMLKRNGFFKHGEVEFLVTVCDV